MPEKFTVLVPVEDDMLADEELVPFWVHYIFDEKLADEHGTRCAGPLRLSVPQKMHGAPLDVPEGWTIVRIDGVGEPNAG